ncbi:2-succinyl-5-enolpyruvyl-6-hydroxy-3-cyclohexene-1-carboxylate synthase [Neiella marina]|uniref:2-succinyl-5-enolpyruvyl-6-hydroxy-3-cyclohexene-1-carboxylate synthase n=1 Tax=Neiella marina TaxID=508461 RepID=A0A8J2XRA4_9GAMM|nr:2-succinyl-5-enolpyruvyl-6-hydroxy-3-cyclohexene-1-carboxylic-acid synthase [Neiella marina]GGA88157.1 2-succinyl-5-enolpyruvyl-6-hydroxy-3-cyclohexene-1-carboxylate synthase [Neiella marina]
MSSIFPTAFSHHNQLWASLLLEELARLGVRHVCLAPGSRSTPLTLAAVANPKLQCHSHFDERGLGFMALGLCKASASPVAVIVTSGTAVANLYPAVVEAFQTQQPLILLTADRPEELIDCGANQAIEQVGIFAHFVVARQNLPAPHASESASDLLTRIDGIYQRCCVQPVRGPIHINCPYREPLYPTEQQQDFAAELAELNEWRQHQQPFVRAELNDPEPVVLAVPALPGVIIAGALGPDEQAAALKLQRQLGWPLLADVQSGLRGQANVINHPELALAQQPDALMQARQFILLGGRLISKSLLRWLEQHEWHHSVQISDHPGPFDAGLVIMQRLKCRVDQFELKNPPVHPPAVCVSDAINQASRSLWQAEALSLSEVNLAAQLQLSMPEQGLLMLGNSLPVRLFEQRFSGCQQIITSRGASGIDGLLATAVGLGKHDASRPLTLVLGDISLLHDLNSLALLSQLQQPLVVIVLNNDGGNIFDLLPVPDGRTLDQYYRMRHGYQFAAAAEQFNLNYQRPADMAEFHQGYQQALALARPTLIELLTEPGEAAADLKQTIADAAALTR